jgi:hypothetical protein
LPSNIRLSCDGLPGKNTSILQILVNYSRNFFITLGAGLCSTHVVASLVQTGLHRIIKLHRFKAENKMLLSAKRASLLHLATLGRTEKGGVGMFFFKPFFVKVFFLLKLAPQQSVR